MTSERGAPFRVTDEPERAGIEDPLMVWPRDVVPGGARRRLVRVSAHLYKHRPDYVALADALRGLRVPFGP